MNKLLAVINKLLHPPKWILFSMPWLVFAVLIFILATGQNNSTPAYIIYSMSAYSLVIWTLAIPKLIKQIQAALSELDGNAAMKELKENGCLKLDSVSSEVVLLEEDLLITMTQAEGFVTEGDNNVTVVMDTRLTPELIEEGFVRELISKIQTMRKEAGFEVMDHIAVSYTADEKVTGIFNKYGEKIQTEVLANAITAGTLAGYQKEWSINGEKVTLAVEKQ